MRTKINFFFQLKSKIANDFLLYLLFNLKVEKVCPEFKTIYNSCESKVTMHFATLTLLLHLEALKSIMKYATDLQSQIEEARETVEPVRSLRRPSMVSETISYLSLNIIEDARKKSKNVT